MEPEETPPLNLEGEKIALGPIRRELVPLYQKWMNDFETVKTLGRTWKPVTTEAQNEWVEKVLRSPETDVVFTIYERRTGGRLPADISSRSRAQRKRRSWRPIGNAGLNGIELLHGKATYGLVIGEPDARGRGLGTEVTKLMLDYGFNVLGLHSVMLTVVAFNPAGIRCYEKAGFKLVGRRREARKHLGQWYDEVYMDVLASEFTSPLLAKKLAPDTPR